MRVNKWDDFGFLSRVPKSEVLEEFSRFSLPLGRCRSNGRTLLLRLCCADRGLETEKRVETPLPQNTPARQQRKAQVNTSCKQADIGSRHPDLTNSRKKRETPNKDTPCNCGSILNNFRIKYEKDQIVLKTLLCTMMRKIEQLEEVQKICEPMGHQYPNRPTAARKPATADAHPASCPQINLVSPKMETSQKILSSNGVYGPPPKQPVHNSRLRAGCRRLCKHNFDRKNYANQNETKMKQNKTKQNNIKRGGGHICG
jgi:hypothetical protein